MGGRLEEADRWSALACATTNGIGSRIFCRDGRGTLAARHRITGCSLKRFYIGSGPVCHGAIYTKARKKFQVGTKMENRLSCAGGRPRRWATMVCINYLPCRSGKLGGFPEQPCQV